MLQEINNMGSLIEFKKIRNKLFSPIIDRLDYIIKILDKVLEKMDFIKEEIGRIETKQIATIVDQGLFNSEFRAFSQWGEDGIIQYLINHLTIEKKIFVEFGVGDYTESNTRFLLTNNNWSGLIIEKDEECIKKIKNNRIYWQYNLKVAQAHITKENINQILEDNGIVNDIGLLSIDVDGNDYWIWEAIDIINPIIVIVEYNHRFGVEKAVTIPYDDQFDRSKAHHSMIYFGASLRALHILARKKAYVFIGCCSNGVNAFFIRKDKQNEFIKETSLEKGYMTGTMCETRDINGVLKKTCPEVEKQSLKDLNLPLVTIEE
jgi:hypothetical protein